MLRSQYVGNGTHRFTVRAARLRERLGRIPGVTVAGDNVYCPSAIAAAIEALIVRTPRRRIREKHEQLDLTL